MKVLVVDDDVVSRMVLMHLIDSCGSFDIVEAEDGADAWQQLEAGLRPAICFCDLRMPRLSGMELLQRVKATPKSAPCRWCWSPRPMTRTRCRKPPSSARRALSSSRSRRSRCACTW
jgi:CheY-like chemotaxis protein